MVSERRTTQRARAALIPSQRIERAIVVLRGHKVLLDEQLAALYEVEVKVLNQAVRRNIERFPEDFMFRLTPGEAGFLRSQIVTLETGRGRHRKYLPYAFTEQGVAMLSSVLRSPRAVRVNIEIMRAFVRLRRMLSTHAELARKLAELEQRYDAQFRAVFDAIRELMAPPSSPRKRIGFVTKDGARGRFRRRHGTSAEDAASAMGRGCSAAVGRWR